MGIGPRRGRKAPREGEHETRADGLVEVNEAFAPQYLAVERELGLDRSRTNVCGGAIATAPFAATGTRITIHLLHPCAREERFGLWARRALAESGGGRDRRSL